MPNSPSLLYYINFHHLALTLIYSITSFFYASSSVIMPLPIKVVYLTGIGEGGVWEGREGELEDLLRGLSKRDSFSLPSLTQAIDTITNCVSQVEVYSQ